MADHLDTLDPLTLQAILAVLHEDAEEVTRSRKGKNRADSPLPDNDLAFAVFNEVLTELDYIAHDRILAESIAKAVDADEAEIQRILEEEEQSRRDRELARTTAVEEGETVPNVTNAAVKQLDDLAASLKNPSFPTFNFEDAGADASSSALAKYNNLNTLPSFQARQIHVESYFKNLTAECAACLEEVRNHNSFECLCGDKFCKPCLRQMFINAIDEESLYPPKCCKIEIPIEKAFAPGTNIFTNEEIRRYRDKAEEYASVKRVYCYNSACGKFLSPKIFDRVLGIARCSHCRSITCIHCGKRIHSGECPEDEDLTKTLELAKLKKWKRCSSCRRMVEKTAACDHMTCVCSYQFCYICCGEWTHGHLCATSRV